MSSHEKIQALHLEIVRLKNATQSNDARHIDIANLLDTKEKLRILEAEAAKTISTLKSK